MAGSTDATIEPLLSRIAKTVSLSNANRLTFGTALSDLPRKVLSS
jgi:hypothetical protein